MKKTKRVSAKTAAKFAPSSAQRPELVQIAVRFSAEFLERADAHAAKLTSGGQNVTRSDVIRMAAMKGIATMETKK